MPNFALKVIRLGFATLGRPFPKASAKLAFALFCRTPSRRPKGGKAQAAEAEGRKRLEAAERMPFPVGKSTVMAYRFNGSGRTGRPRYLVVHGWGSNAAYISALPAGLAETGAEVVVLDLPGHGRSSGRSLNMRQAVDAVVEAERHFGRFDAAIGHSFGGAALMLAAGGVMRGAGAINPSKLVVIGSPSHIHWLFDEFSRMIGLTPRVKKQLIVRAEQVAGASLEDFDTVAAAARGRTPLLVVHAEEDKEVAADHARRFDGLATARLHWANGLGHRRIVSDRGVIETIASFLSENGRPVHEASGGDAAA
ncbi:alpha/beta hydrolase [Neorhizobium petrolearium]|uniref:Alpha/beta hydrolase n=1 Tax=Neorhizobium petrolearium TaxID=515361 RepID=A0ABY8M8W2_9HYPH|nr:alpha/beta hydrolase [Neorhizobium petrolearium]MCC2610018.1 alpha/beta hydrolase [Neorhizobium petrolearium]WGI70196.1 alpha/beta hydrolase [Neorhizobium petrolearium]